MKKVHTYVDLPNFLCRHVRILAEPDPASSSAASWPTTIQTALHLYVDGNASGVEDTTPGKYSERLVLCVAFLIVSGAVIGSYFLSTYIGIVLSILICICIFLIVAIPYCCRFCTSYRRYVMMKCTAFSVNCHYYF